MDDYKHLCPVCKSKGNATFLQLRQIDLTTAVYLCKDVRCIYPQGHSWIFVQRNLFDNDSDSDSSDCSISDDIERMTLAKSNPSMSSPKYVNDNDTAKQINLSHTLTNNCKEPTNKNTQILEKCVDKNDINCNLETGYVVTDNSEKQNLVCNASIENSKSENVVICDPEDLFSTSNFPSNIKTSDLQIKVIATGAPDSEVVDLNLPEVVANHTYQIMENGKELGKNQENQNKKEEIKMVNMIKPKTNFKIVDMKTADMITDKNVKLIHVRKLDFGNVNVIPDLSKVIALNTISKSNATNLNLKSELENLPCLGAENISQSAERKKEPNVNKNDERPKRRKQSRDLLLPSIENNESRCSLKVEKPKFEFKSTLKLQSRKEKQTKFCFSDSILEDALKTVEKEKAEEPKNRSLVNIILGQSQSAKTVNYSAASFEGFKFSTKIIKPVKPDAEEKKMEPKVVKIKKGATRKNCKKKLECDQLETNQNIDNNYVSNESASNSDLLELNELFDDINHLGKVNVPSDSANISEVDDWLNSLCQ